MVTNKDPVEVPEKLKEEILSVIPAGLVDTFTEFIHDSWWVEKKKQGFVSPRDFNKKWMPGDPLPKQCDTLKVGTRAGCHEDMVPYEDLPESSKKFDAITANTVIMSLFLSNFMVTVAPKSQRKLIRNYIMKDAPCGTFKKSIDLVKGYKGWGPDTIEKLNDVYTERCIL